MEELRTKYGRLWHGDCLDLLPRIPPGRINMVFADLPYGTTACKWDVVIPFAPLWDGLSRACQPKVALVFTATQPFTSELVHSKIDWFKHEWIWNKLIGVGFQAAKHRPMQCHESVLVFGINGATVPYTPIKQNREKHTTRTGYRKKSEVSPLAKEHGGLRVYTDLYPKSIITISGADHSNVLHPSQKPVALIEYLIKTYSQKDDWILDPTCGSATTAIACINTGRRFVCIEKEADIYQTAKNRIERHIRKFESSFGFTQ